jgi:hypothetical protein
MTVKIVSTRGYESSCFVNSVPSSSFAAARHQNTCRRRGDERRDLRNQAVTDGKQREALQRFPHRHPLLHDADGKTAEHIDQCNQDGRDGVAAHKLARTVHRPVEIRLLLHFAAASARVGLVDDARVQFGVDRHLLARHRVQGESRRDFRDAARALGDDDEIDQDQDEEDDEADDIIAAHHEIAEGLDDVARVTIEQNQPRRGNVEG